MEKENTLGLPISIVISAAAVVIIGILCWISARQIYMKLVVYHYPAAVKPWMWVNVVVGVLSVIAVVGICIYYRFNLQNAAAWWIGGIVVLNIAMRIVEEFLFFVGSKGQWVG
jgi:hypothetical protein